MAAISADVRGDGNCGSWLGNWSSGIYTAWQERTAEKQLCFFPPHSFIIALSLNHPFSQ